MSSLLDMELAEFKILVQDELIALGYNGTLKTMTDERVEELYWDSFYPSEAAFDLIYDHDLKDYYHV